MTDLTDTPAPAEKAINLPPMTAALAALMLVIHAAIQWVDAPIVQILADNMVFIPSLFRDAPYTILSFGFIHATWLHLGVNLLGFIAFGSGVERLWGKLWLVGLLLGGSALGAFVFLGLYPSSVIPLVGASGGISALFGALLPQLTLREGAPARQFLAPAWIFILSNIALGVIGMPDEPGLTIAWQAHIAGFVMGSLIGLYRLKKTRQKKTQDQS